MFRLVTIEDVVQVAPRDFKHPRFVALEREVNAKYANKILSGVGVCIALWDFVSAGDDRLMPATGESNTSCKFRLVVFAPAAGEILHGHVNRASADGVHVDLAFLGGVLVPKDELPGIPSYDEKEKAWRIRFDGGEDDAGGAGGAGGAADDVVENVLDAGNAVAFRVVSVKFTDGVDKPPEPPAKGAKRRRIMTMKGSMKDEGLGRYEWWATPEEAPEEEEPDAEMVDGGEGEEEDYEEYGEYDEEEAPGAGGAEG